MHRRRFGLFALIFTAFGGSACQAHTDADRIAEIKQFFAKAQLVAGPTIVDCTLSQGSKSRCFSITVKADPKSYKPGPWCPTDISDGADKGGIWLRDGQVHDVDGAFIKNLASFYGDARWQLFDPQTGKIRFTGTLEACEAAARPDVDPAYQNHCVQCLPEYMRADATMTYVIPLEPQRASRREGTRVSGSGVAYNGIRLDGPAPLDAILAAYTIAPFDDCGGHVNTHVGYHYHAVTDCLNDAPASTAAAGAGSVASHGSRIGIAMDGHPIFPHTMADRSVPAGLDACNGHEATGLGYHYHAGAAGSNAILACLSAQAGCAFESPAQTCDASSRPRRP